MWANERYKIPIRSTSTVDELKSEALRRIFRGCSETFPTQKYRMLDRCSAILFEEDALADVCPDRIDREGLQLVPMPDEEALSSREGETTTIPAPLAMSTLMCVPPDACISFSPKDRVRINGLLHAREYNGFTGTVLHSCGEGRVAVSLDIPSAAPVANETQTAGMTAAKTVQLHCSNLRHLSCPNSDELADDFESNKNSIFSGGDGSGGVDVDGSSVAEDVRHELESCREDQIVEADDSITTELTGKVSTILLTLSGSPHDAQAETKKNGEEKLDKPGSRAHSSPMKPPHDIDADTLSNRQCTRKKRRQKRKKKNGRKRATRSRPSDHPPRRLRTARFVATCEQRNTDGWCY